VKNSKYDDRRFFMGGLVIAVLLVFIVRLFSLQILNPKYRDSAASNAFLHKTVYPPRGVIFDRNGRLLVNNQPSYDVTMVMREVHDLDTLAFCKVLGIDRATFDQRMTAVKDLRRNPGYSTYTIQVFMSQLSQDEVAPLRERLYMFPGFDIQKRTFRLYSYPVAAHLLGDIAEVSKSELDADDYYRQGDFIGKQGVERQYEKILRGEKGEQILLKDAKGRIQGSYMDGALDVQPVAGKDITLGIDIDLQLLGERLMKNKIGSIVAIEPSTGQILCMVSAPTYDPSELVGRHRSENYLALSELWSKPLINRTIMGTYPPGSTFKTAQALVMQQEGIINTSTLFPCSHGFVYRGLRVGCHDHASPIALKEAIATSCNGYFCWGYYRLIGADKYGSPQQAMTVWKDYMVAQGFGYALGIDLPGEKRGMIPNAQYYDRIYNRHWNGLTIISNSIGQGEVTLTPLQIANLGATIANRGYYITPHVVKEIEGENLDSVYLQKKYTGIDREYYDNVVDGMRLSVLNGTCRAANNEHYEACGKTGTAQNNGKDHSAFMGFAPMNDPRIAVAVYVENGGFGAAYGVPIGSLLMELYLTGELSEASLKKVESIENSIIAYDERKR